MRNERKVTPTMTGIKSSILLAINPARPIYLLCLFPNGGPLGEFFCEVTGRPVSSSYFSKLWLRRVAYLLGIRASGMESATGRRTYRARNLTPQIHTLKSIFGVGLG